MVLLDFILSLVVLQKHLILLLAELHADSLALVNLLGDCCSDV